MNQQVELVARWLLFKGDVLRLMSGQEVYEMFCHENPVCPMTRDYFDSCVNMFLAFNSGQSKNHRK